MGLQFPVSALVPGFQAVDPNLSVSFTLLLFAYKVAL